MKVLFVLPNLDGGGAERVALTVMGGLDRSRFEPALFMVKNEGVLWSEIPADVRVSTALPAGCRMRWHMPRIVRRLAKAARETDIIIGALEFEAIYFAVIAARVAKRPVIGWVHADIDMYAPGFMKHNLNGQALKSLERILTVSDAVTAGIGRWYPDLGGKIRRVYSPLDLDHIREQAAAQCSADDSELPLIVGVGRLDKIKNFELLILAHAELLSRGIRQRLVIMGEGPERDKLERLIRSRGLEETVSLPGFLNNPFSLMKQASILVVCSHYEGFSMVALEAMALGVPVVATDLASGPVEVLDEGRYGLIVPGHRAALADGITSLLSDESLAAYYRQMGLARADQFRPELKIPEFERVLEEIYPAGKAE